jgi:hypothetical protein
MLYQCNHFAVVSSSCFREGFRSRPAIGYTAYLELAGDQQVSARAETLDAALFAVFRKALGHTLKRQVPDQPLPEGSYKDTLKFVGDLFSAACEQHEQRPASQNTTRRARLAKASI